MSKDIYEKDAIDRAIVAFSSWGGIQLDDDGRYWICSLSGSGLNDGLVLREFENYVIDSIVSGHHHGA